MSNNITSSLISTPRKPTIKERLASAKTAYLSFPSALPGAVKNDLLNRVRRKFSHLRLGSFQSEFEDTRDWRKHIAGFLADIDVLIVAIDASRMAGGGVRHEIERARSANKLILLFDITTNRQMPYCGYDLIEAVGKPKAIKLRERAQLRTQEKINE